MNYRNDKVNDALEVLAIMRSEFQSTRGLTPTELRIAAVKRFAKRELQAGKRFKDEISAERTVADALARRLKLKSIHAFDALAGQWLTSGSAALKDLLTSHSKDQSQRALVRDFFQSPTPP